MKKIFQSIFIVLSLIVLFACVVNSTFGGNSVYHIDDAFNRTFIYLDPENENFHGLDGVMKFDTSNPNYFWSEP